MTKRFLHYFVATCFSPAGLGVIALTVTLATTAGAQSVERGQTKAAACAACHGPQGNSTNPQWPKIAGQGAKYIVKQLELFKDKHRVNALMNEQVASLSKTDIHDLAAYFSKQKITPGAADKNYVELGQSIYRGGIQKKNVPACLSCHGPAGEGNPAASFPRLGGQHAAYTTVRLRAYRAGSAYPGSEIMNHVAKPLSDEEIRAVSSYMQGLH